MVINKDLCIFLRILFDLYMCFHGEDKDTSFPVFCLVARRKTLLTLGKTKVLTEISKVLRVFSKVRSVLGRCRCLWCTKNG